MLRMKFPFPLTTMAAALVVLALPGKTNAQVAITPTVTLNGSLFTYMYSVANSGTDTLALTTFDVAALPNAIFNPIAPAGFQISFDSGLGLVSFLEDSDANTPGAFDPGTNVGGFSFQSAFAPATSNFSALDISGSTFTGTTLAPTGTAVPEPGSVALGVTLLTGLALLPRRRK